MPCIGHYAQLPTAVQGRSTAEQSDEETHTRQIAELAAHCRTVFETDPIIRSNIDRRFNAQYQDLHDEVPLNNLQIKQRERDLRATLDAFRQYSEVVSELIILQQQLPATMRIIAAAADLGGLAGGEKFKVGHVVFKFARDWQHIYGAFVGFHGCSHAQHDSNSVYHCNHIVTRNLFVHTCMSCCRLRRLRLGRIQGVVCRDALFTGGD